MRRTFGLLALSSMGVVAFAALQSSSLLTDFSKSIHDAQSLKTEYIYQQIGGLRENYAVSLKKPNLARIDSPTQLIVADGTNISTYDKNLKTFYKQPESQDLLASLFTTDALNTWSGFFTEDAYKPVSSRDLGTTSRGDKTFSAVETKADKLGNKTVTYFLDPSDKVARQVEIGLKKGSDKDTFLLRTKSFDLNAAGSDLFAFNAPSGAQEVSLADVLAGKWFTSFKEAKKFAATSHRKIFVDFMATWCGPCHKLDDEVLKSDRFKKLAAEKKLVLCKVDVDLNPDLAKKYGAEAIPMQDVMDADGNVLAKTVGYGDPESFYSFLNSAVSK